MDPREKELKSIFFDLQLVENKKESVLSRFASTLETENRFLTSTNQ